MGLENNGVRRGVSIRVEDVPKLLTVRAGHPTGHRRVGDDGPKGTLGSPWPPHAVRPWVQNCSAEKILSLTVPHHQKIADPYSVGYPRGQKTAAGCPPCGGATPEKVVRPFWGGAHPQGVKRVGHGGPG
jgi:hypothetical protein